MIGKKISLFYFSESFYVLTIYIYNFRVPEDEWMSIMDYDDYTSEDEVEDYSTKPVPIWLSICLVIGYIIGGAKLFQVH